MDLDFDTRGARPNFLARSVAKIALSVRSKLLIAFLGITCLLAGLTLFGLFALHHANVRTEALVRDQERIAYFNNISSALGELNAMTLSLIIDEVLGEQFEEIFSFSAAAFIGQINNLEVLIGRGVRQFGQENKSDAVMIESLREDIKSLEKSAYKMVELRDAGSTQFMTAVGLDGLFHPIRAMQRETYNVVRRIELEMQNRARTTAQAYLTSRQNIVATALIAVGTALLLGYSISSSLLWPIERIRHALNRLSGGGFETRIAVPNRDELGELAGHVNRTSSKLGALYDEVEAQKQQLAEWNNALETRVANQVDEIERTNRLKRYLPAQVATMIVDATDEADILRTQRAEITVLFADLRGFSAFATAATPDQVVTALNTFHGACGPLKEKSSGTVERFLGDGLMVLFGAPVPTEHAAQKAVDLALEMLVTVRAAMSSFQAGTDGRSLGLGIGIGTGAATLGQIGFEGRLDYSAIGPAPNLAARLCDKAMDGQILISHATAWQVESEMKPAGPFDLKGIGQGIAAFELVTLGAHS